jgi:hypothetical protein
MSRFNFNNPAIKRIVRWTPSLSVPLTGTAYAWVTLTLTLPETVDWTKTVLVIEAKGFYRQVALGGASASYGVIWRPGADGNSATVYVKCAQTGTKTWTPECELWLLDNAYTAYHLYGNWDTANTAGNYYTNTATCGDANAAARAVLWLPNMEYDPCNACITNDTAYLTQTGAPYRDSSNNSCLTYKDNYGNSNIFYSFTYVYKR